MIIGIPKEIKNNEFRVSATPSGVHAYVQSGHTVLVESGAGLGSAAAEKNLNRITTVFATVWLFTVIALAFLLQN